MSLRRSNMFLPAQPSLATRFLAIAVIAVQLAGCSGYHRLSPPDPTAEAWDFSSLDVGQRLKIGLVDGQVLKGRLLVVRNHEIILGIPAEDSQEERVIRASQIEEIHRRQILWVPTTVISAFMVYGVLLISGELDAR